MRIWPLMTLLYMPWLLAEPSWYTQPIVMKGKVVETSCKGVGAAEDIAYVEALDACKSIAASNMASKTKIDVLAVETNNDAALHKTVITNATIEGLYCDQKNIASEQNGDSFTVYLRCKFDVGKARVIDQDNEAIRSATVKSGASDPVLSKAKYLTSGVGTLSLSTVPKCESVIIVGIRSRTVQCKLNPTLITLYPGDAKAIIRARNYKPKEILINGSKGDVALEIILD